MKEKLKKILQFIVNPRLLLCFGLAWMITNGWCYVFLILGAWLKIGWMSAIGGAYLAFLWLPITPEKLITIPLSIALLRFFFPNDTKTLGVLRDLYAKAKEALSAQKNKKKKKDKQEGASSHGND